MATSRHWFIRMKQLEQLVTVAVSQFGPITIAALHDKLGTEDGVADALHSLKMRGSLTRSDSGFWSAKPVNGAPAPAAAAAVHIPAVIEQKENPPMTEPDTKKCPACGEKKPLEEMRSNGYCKTCARAKSNAAYRAKKVATAATVKNYVGRGRKKTASTSPVPDPPASPRMVLNLFRISIADHAGKQHDLVLSYDTVKQLLTELKDCTR
jgi:hypothetical protein